MLATTLLMLGLGAVLALFGTAGFALNWAAPDHDSLRFAQALAKTGRRLSAAGLTLYALAHYGASGATLILLIGVGVTAAATYLTATSNTIVPSGA